MNEGENKERGQFRYTYITYSSVPLSAAGRVGVCLFFSKCVNQPHTRNPKLFFEALQNRKNLIKRQVSAIIAYTYTLYVFTFSLYYTSRLEAFLFFFIPLFYFFSLSLLSWPCFIMHASFDFFEHHSHSFPLSPFVYC